MLLSRKPLILLLSAALLLSACDNGFDPRRLDTTDRPLDLQRQDFRNMMKPALKTTDGSLAGNGDIVIKAETKTPPIPSIAPILAAPRPPKIGQTKLVSLTVTDDVPLKDVLIELARLADVDIEVDSGIEGGVTFRAKERPFNEVIERISDLAGLRYSMDSGVLRVERDAPFVNNYNLNFLNLVRSSESSVNISTDVLALASAGSDGDGGSGISTGSTSSITSSSEDDFWESLDNGIKSILQAKSKKLRSNSADEEADEDEASSGDDETELPDGSYYILNKQAGLLSVAASQKQHEVISNFLKVLEYNASAQVLIEAKIIEVSLDDQYSSGINWDLAKGNGALSTTFPSASVIDTAVTSLAFTDGNFGVGLNGAVNLMEKFGTTRTLSSPRLHAINNQQAVLTFAENRIFFEVEVTQEDAQIAADGSVTSQAKTTVESTRRSVPIGIILNILPSVDLRRGEVTLNVRPTLSRQVASVTDPGSAIVNQILKDSDPDAPTFTNEVPIVEVRELDSILKIKSGHVMVIGGLMEESSTNTDTGIPMMSEVPWLGNLFKNVEKTDKTKELVIFIRATIIGTSGNHHKADRHVYEKFSNDARPLFK